MLEFLLLFVCLSLHRRWLLRRRRGHPLEPLSLPLAQWFMTAIDCNRAEEEAPNPIPPSEPTFQFVSPRTKEFRNRARRKGGEERKVDGIWIDGRQFQSE